MITKSSMQRITRKEGKVHKVRFSKASVDRLTNAVNDIGGEIAAHAKELAEHAKRRTVNDKDIKLVLK